MERIVRMLAALGLIGSLAGGGAKAAVTVDQIEYHGWHGAYRMSNGTVDLVVVPQIGRIMRYGYVGGPNVLWENPDLRGTVPEPRHLSPDWINYGGDKLWNAPQSEWGWPPDEALDRGAYGVTLVKGARLLLNGRPSARFGLRFRREITLAPRGTGVTIRNILINDGRKKATWAIWEVAQIDDPSEVRLPRSETGRFDQGYHLFNTYTLLPGMLRVSLRKVSLRRSGAQPAKIGSDAPDGWIEGIVAGQTFKISSAHETNKNYADEGCSQQIFTNGDPLKYAEMEMLGPLVDIRVSRSVSLVTHWSLSAGRKKKM